MPVVPGGGGVHPHPRPRPQRLRISQEQIHQNHPDYFLQDVYDICNLGKDLQNKKKTKQ